jgi:uncharacterized membrane protein YhhN
VSGSPVEVARARRTRLIWIVAITVAVEIGLFILVKVGPALEDLVRPVYWVVAAIGVITTWHALRRHPGTDRRHADRRGRGR